MTCPQKRGAKSKTALSSNSGGNNAQTRTPSNCPVFPAAPQLTHKRKRGRTRPPNAPLCLQFTRLPLPLGRGSSARVPHSDAANTGTTAVDDRVERRMGRHVGLPRAKALPALVQQILVWSI
ncbi:hypothetical protein BJV78DRAFT_1179081 [Lactifluus subvellereus]|nr:hypothetical protein BJV78DRAFT_1179081 [Lactifluus subvellereus]